MSAIIRPVVDITAKRADIMQYINQVYEDDQRQELQHDHVQHQQCLNRNVLLVGFPKSGKTTLIHILDDPRYVSEELSLLSSSEEAPEFEFTISLPSSRLTLNILEIPGTMIDGITDLSQINQLCVDRGLSNVHLICFCTSFHTGIDRYVIQSFLRLIQHLGREQLRPHLCLIVTRFESKDEAQRKKLLNELRQDAYFSSITRYLGRGIHFSGALNRDDWNRASEVLYDQFENVYNYRKNIFALLEGSAETFDMRPQSASSLSIRLPVQTQIHQELPESTFFPTNREKPWLTRAGSTKPTSSSSSLIHTYVSCFSLITLSPSDS